MEISPCRLLVSLSRNFNAALFTGTGCELLLFGWRNLRLPGPNYWTLKAAFERIQDVAWVRLNPSVLLGLNEPRTPGFERTQEDAWLPGFERTQEQKKARQDEELGTGNGKNGGRLGLKEPRTPPGFERTQEDEPRCPPGRLGKMRNWELGMGITGEKSSRFAGGKCMVEVVNPMCGNYPTEAFHSEYRSGGPRGFALNSKQIVNRLFRRVELHTEEELIKAIETATGPKDSLCFIEVIVHKDDTSKELLEWGSRVSAANIRPPNPH
ncbi:hypothetical protein SLEP1_g31929 [Rubroshorea leprosula]|uniref:Pyruvate decarboxylase n=1 Tax=Rubroshorea leprosula TaxID=152421 RepID=A0AAV5KBR4_9ROSI|nr:hypothetical protein SLEP1_g31929 [Rubroshorea leprosula]